MGSRALRVVGAQTWEEAVVRARAGSREEQARVVGVVAPRVRTMLRRVLGPDAELDDLTQDALAGFLLALPRLRQPDQVVAFAEHIAINIARSRLRRRKVLRFLSLGELSAEGDEGLPPGPAADHTARAAIRSLYAALDRVPVEERLAFVLRHVEQHSLEETAERLGCSLATAKRRLAACAVHLEGELASAAALSDWLERAP